MTQLVPTKLAIEALLNYFQHPGGEEIILENGGEDCSEAFEDASHSNDAKEMLKQFCIGHLAQVSFYQIFPQKCVVNMHNHI